MYGAWSQLSYLWDLEEQRGEEHFKVTYKGGNASQKWRRQFLWGSGVVCCIETLLQVFLGTIKDLIGYHFFLYYCCFTCVVSIGIGKAKSTI